MSRIIKRIVDIIGSIIALLLLWPVLCVFGVGIKLSSPGRMLYVQKRVGFSCKPFNIYKLRTMYDDSDKRLEERLTLDYSARKEYGEFRCLNNDPRVVGYWAEFSRKYSIDEIPQFINVLAGEMSLVGPRPLCEKDFKSYIPFEYHLQRQSVKPGITGLWQVSRKGKHEAVKNMAELDVIYTNNNNLLLDIKIIMKTFVTVFNGTGHF
jgi:undecaprenyl-phosphate galactose phosphotransferase